MAEILEKSDVKGMHTFDQSLLQLYKAGKISEKDALRYADSEHDLKIKIQIESDTAAGAASSHREMKLQSSKAEQHEGIVFHSKHGPQDRAK